MALPKRTNKTNLTDDELFILDWYALLGKSSPPTSEDYPIHMNCSYTHHYSDQALEARIREMVCMKWLFQETEEGNETFGLANEGGKRWEKERQPVWRTYCSESSYPDSNGVWYLEISCIEKNVGCEFARVSLSSNLYAFDNSTLGVREEKVTLPYWRPPQKGYVWYAKLGKEYTFSPMLDWELYESQRTWWRTLRELQTISK